MKVLGQQKFVTWNGMVDKFDRPMVDKFDRPSRRLSSDRRSTNAAAMNLQWR